ncbi:GDP-mannose 4,6-dehydratase [Bacillus sp. ISL-47]|uniref:GDP-mannose 4,6-dehydratase n=1 Tax=Bacillus sp. ISL-47 TaxID=2819130 RepID=UPI001BED2FA3|nr:GDP-mannose 4,6-dehydratase [Bacillus sp. ISL-47]MBT2686892.1 GDP-mannose 4,6-dehydratase [Bacillus sp. ISL-47]MBT2710431.1 GDP-mannose 4,6-dehydratase [Pseudomonas sp. ISL-84]
MKALITGVSGFVGQYLEKFLIARSIPVYGTTRTKNNEKNWLPLDLMSEDQIASIIKKIKPSHIFHLAGFSNVHDSWNARKEVIQANVIATMNLFEAVKKVNKDIRIITVGSSEEYGYVETMPVTEKAPLNPISPYGVSKAAISMMGRQYVRGDGLDIIHVRPFNHIGPGQRRGFVTSDFAYQIALIDAGKRQSRKMKIGNLEAVRDFTDVRDIIAAYYEIAVNGNTGDVYNVCSGIGIKVKMILEVFLSYSSTPIDIVLDDQKKSPAEIKSIVGSNEKLITLTNWRPQIKLKQSLKDIYEYWYLKINIPPN